MKQDTSTSPEPSKWYVLRKLFHIGLGVKRWILIGTSGVGVCSVGIAFVIKNILDLNLPDVLPWYFEGVVIGFSGVLMIIIALYGLYKSLSPFLLRYQNVNSLAHTIYTRRVREKGPRIVTIGGGTGLSRLLRGLKKHSNNLTAIITVADDGGSSGRLRRDFDLVPPGDFRNCLVAMSEEEGLVSNLFQYRFEKGNDLKGHSFGNLFIAALTNTTGSFDEALRESSRVLAVRGNILPSTKNPLNLVAQLKDGSTIRGESKIGQSKKAIEKISIEPDNSEAYPEAISSINDAELIVIGPGSLYTSLLSNLLVPGIVNSIRKASAPVVYICNVATEKGETDGYTLNDHVSVIENHTFPEIIDVVVANSKEVHLEPELESEPVRSNNWQNPRIKIINSDIVDTNQPLHHDPDKLAQAVIDVYHGIYT